VQEYQPLFNFDPPVTPEEVRAALSSSSEKSPVSQTVETNEEAFQAAIEKSQKYQGV